MAGAKHFFSAISPTVCLTCILGICPVFINYRGNALFTHKYLYCVSIGFVLFYSAVLVRTVNESRKNVMSNSYYKSNKVSNIGIAFEFFGSVTYFYSTHLAFLFKANAMKNTIAKLYKVDVTLARFGQDLKYTRMVLYQLTTQLPSIVVVILNAIVQNENIKREGFPPLSPSIWFLFVYPLAVVNIFENQFSYIVLFVHRRFLMLNEQLDLVDQEENNSELHLRKIDTLMRMYDELCDVTRELSSNYTLPISVALVFQYSIIMFSIFYCYWMFTTKPISVLCWSVWALINIGDVLHTTVSCHLAANQANNTGRIVHKLLLKPFDKKIKDGLMSFSRLLMHRQVKFTIWGMFPYNASLLFTMISAAATYMIIMLQFQQSSLPMTCKITNTATRNGTKH